MPILCGNIISVNNTMQESDVDIINTKTSKPRIFNCLDSYVNLLYIFYTTWCILLARAPWVVISYFIC